MVSSGVASALHLDLGLVDGAAEAVVDLLMDAVLVLVPDQIGDAVDGGLQVLAGLPVVPAELAGLLPAQKAEAELLPRQGRDPDVLQGVQAVGQQGELLTGGQHDELRLLPLAGGQRRQSLLHVQLPQVRQNHVCPGRLSRVGPGAPGELVGKAGKRGHLPEELGGLGRAAHQIEMNGTVIHIQSPHAPQRNLEPRPGLSRTVHIAIVAIAGRSVNISRTFSYNTSPVSAAKGRSWR